MNKTIAVDFDGVLCRDMWPHIGPAHLDVIEALKERQAGGDRLILWTCRSGQKLAEASEWCREHGLYFDAINSNLPEHIERYGNDCRKVFADEYWDDKAIRVTCEYEIMRIDVPRSPRPPRRSLVERLRRLIFGEGWK